MYLNLDLLYNTYDYLYPLFYYKNPRWGYIIYSPITKKFVYENACQNTHYDFNTKKHKDLFLVKIFDFDDTEYIITENIINLSGSIYNKCKSFKLTKENIFFLKSNTRIN